MFRRAARRGNDDVFIELVQTVARHEVIIPDHETRIVKLEEIAEKVLTHYEIQGNKIDALLERDDTKHRGDQASRRMMIDIMRVVLGAAMTIMVSFILIFVARAQNAPWYVLVSIGLGLLIVMMLASMIMVSRARRLEGGERRVH